MVTSGLLQVQCKCTTILIVLNAERTKKEIISEATYNQMFQLLHKLPYSCRHVVVLLTVPIVFPGTAFHLV